VAKIVNNEKAPSKEWLIQTDFASVGESIFITDTHTVREAARVRFAQVFLYETRACRSQRGRSHNACLGLFMRIFKQGKSDV
jgi:hypothetical protein